jgi:hypothetical protein
MGCCAINVLDDFCRGGIVESAEQHEKHDLTSFSINCSAIKASFTRNGIASIITDTA